MPSCPVHGLWEPAFEPRNIDHSNQIRRDLRKGTSDVVTNRSFLSSPTPRHPQYVVNTIFAAFLSIYRHGSMTSDDGDAQHMAKNER